MVKTSRKKRLVLFVRLVHSVDAGKAQIVGPTDRWTTWIVVIALSAAAPTWLVTGEIIRAFACAELHSEHPLGKAVQLSIVSMNACEFEPNYTAFYRDLLSVNQHQSIAKNIINHSKPAFTSIHADQVEIALHDVRQF